MARTAYSGINGIANKIKSIYTGIGGLANKCLRGYVGINGIAQLFWSSFACIKGAVGLIASAFAENLESGEMLDVIVINTTQDPLNITRTGKNLLNKSNVLLNLAMLSITTHWITSAGSRVAWIKCYPNIYYTVSKIASYRFSVSFSNVIPGINVPVLFGISKAGQFATVITALSPVNANYLNVVFWNTVDTSANVGLTPEQVLNSIQIEMGSIATPYEPYISNTYSIPLIDAQRGFKIPALPGVNNVWSDNGTTVVETNCPYELPCITGATDMIAQAYANMPGRNLPMDISTKLIAVQTGSGTPTPENIRNIVGRNNIVVSRTGKNIFNKSNIMNITWTNTSPARFLAGNVVTAYARCAPQMTYKVSRIPGTRPSVVFSQNKPSIDEAVLTYNNVVPPTIDGKWVTTITAPANAFYISVFLWQSGDSYPEAQSLIDSLQIEVSPTNTPYESFIGDEYSVSLLQPLYGLSGAEDIIQNNGTIIQNTKILVLNGNENWTTSADPNQINTISVYASVAGLNISTSIATISDKFQFLSSYTSDVELLRPAPINNAINLRVLRSRLATNDLAGVKLWLQNNNVTSLWKVLTPITLLIAPFTVKSLQGINNVWSDGGGQTTVGTNCPFVVSAGLTTEQLKTIIQSLPKSNGQILQLGSNINKITDADIAIAVDKGWVVV